MSFSIEINGVETKCTLCGAILMLLYNTNLVVLTLITLINRGLSFNALLNIVLVAASTTGTFSDQPHCSFLVRSYGHRAVYIVVTTLFCVSQNESRGDAPLVIQIIVGSVFFLGHVVAMIVSCVSEKSAAKDLAAMDERTRAAAPPSSKQNVELLNENEKDMIPASLLEV